jgi:beta-xylosidase
MRLLKPIQSQLLSILLLVVVLSCSARRQVNHTKEDNNIIQLADPTILYANGTYYLYGTGGSKHTDGFAVNTSKDLKKWTGAVGANEGYAFKKGNGYGTEKFWAPQVFKHNSKYYIAYAASEHIGIATGDNPLGPFTQKVSNPISEETKQIDPFVFVDDNGKKYLYYVVVANGGNRIFVAELNDDMLSVKKETAKLCIEATDTWENTNKDKWSVTEGPTVIKRNNLYYLLYSANHFKWTDYAVGYAVSKSPFGPWQKYERNPIIHKSVTGQNGSGHGDLVKGKNNQWMYVFHTHYSSEKIAPRKTAIIRLNFIKNKKSGSDILVADPKSFSYLYQTSTE